MNIRIALAGNPNAGKTTLFNALTGSNQFVGNWPGVTVEKKEGKYKKNKNIIITDLPGIYSLSPYTLEEVVARNYLIQERPNVILNIVDGTNLERNLYLTTQLIELGIPVVMAINMIDVVHKNGDQIHLQELSSKLGIQVFEISALTGYGIDDAINAAITFANITPTIPQHTFCKEVEETLKLIEEKISNNISNNQKRWYAIKIFERDQKVLEQLKLDEEISNKIENEIQACESKLDDDSESIITNERYTYISNVIYACYVKKDHGKLSTSDRIDQVLTNRWLGLPIFAIIMFMVYWIAMGPFGTLLTDWTNDGIFGDGWHLFGIGSEQYHEASEQYGDTDQIIDAFISEYGNDDITNALDIEADTYNETEVKVALEELLSLTPIDASITYEVEDEETLATTQHKNTTKYDLENAISEYTNTEYKDYYGTPDASTYGIWIPGIPVFVDQALDTLHVSNWLRGLINDGIIAGVGAVLGFVPQMLVLFFLLAFLESCGYMARIAFVLDRIFRRFGLSGKSFIPMLVGTGCGVPGIMASRTIENESDRRMTIITTTFIPCGAKIPFIAMIAGALFDDSPLISTSAYFIGMSAIIISGLILKKTRPFCGEPAPFVMELPSYHLPTFSNLLKSMWERGWSFIKKAGTIILLSTIIIWFTTYFGFVDGTFRMLVEEEISCSLLAQIGNLIAWIFTPLGWGTWEASVASITGLVAKENIVGTMGILYRANGNVYQALASTFTKVTGFSFLVFNLLCAPCFAAIGAIKREMNHMKWTWFAIAYQCGFAYCISLMITQFGNTIIGKMNVFGFFTAIVILIFMITLVVRPNRKVEK